ncbi:hypothetical protein ABE527_17525 [Brucella sp. TWI432]
MKKSFTGLFISFVGLIACSGSGFADQTASEPTADNQPIEWDFSCVPLSDFAKTQGGSDEVRFNNFMVTEGAVPTEPTLPMATLEIGFTVTNRTSNKVYWSAEFLGFASKMMPTFVASAAPTFGYIFPNKIETISTRIRVPDNTLARTELMCLRINSH